MLRPLPYALALLALAAFAAPAEIIDRTAAIVGAAPILESEIDLELRLAALFNETPVPESSPQLRRQTLTRLIERRLITSAMALSGFSPISNQELEQAYEELRRRRFGTRSLEQAIADYGVSAADVRAFLAAQLNFVRYLDFRFRTGLDVTPQQIQALYKSRYGQVQDPPALGAVENELRDELLDQQVDRMLNERVRGLQAETRVEILEPIAPDEAPK
jgi:parvulin-like peptidyl-prolyl isomerase